MARTKQRRLLKVKQLPNVFSSHNPDVKEIIQNFFKSNNLFTLEIGCGHGDYSTELAKKFPGRNFIGIDVKGARVFHGAMNALEAKLDNVAFIVGKAEKLYEIFPLKSVDEIYIPFPDPHVRRANHNRRLISPTFLNIFRQILIDSGTVHFKTDNKRLYEYALTTISDFECKILYATDNLYNNDDVNPGSMITTLYEKHYIKDGRKILYLCFRF
jgi:tRNA (guanine-N7-)-methyltransferase